MESEDFRDTLVIMALPLHKSSPGIWEKGDVFLNTRISPETGERFYSDHEILKR
jgi:hypothetical protein